MERLRAGNSTNMQLKNRISALLSTAIPWSEQYCTVVLDESSPALSQVGWNTSSSTSRRAAGGHMEEIRALNMAVESSQDEPGSLCRLYGQPVDAFIASDVHASALGPHRRTCAQNTCADRRPRCQLCSTYTSSQCAIDRKTRYIVPASTIQNQCFKKLRK